MVMEHNVTVQQILHPELLENKVLIQMLEERHFKINNVKDLSRENLLDIFRSCIVPLPQRKRRDAKEKQASVHASDAKSTLKEDEAHINHNRKKIKLCDDFKTQINIQSKTNVTQKRPCPFESVQQNPIAMECSSSKRIRQNISWP